MITDSYEYKTNQNKTLFGFTSEGKQGKIRKVIVFTPMPKNVWNLAFGDVIDNDINDSIISNNNDMVKVFGTIAKVVYEFSEQYPSRQIHVKPVDEKRKMLYNRIFRNNHQHINRIFEIRGSINKRIEIYSPEKIYDYFKLKRKFVK